MIVKRLGDVSANPVAGYTGVAKSLVIGPDDGSNEILLRYFSLKPGGCSPRHAHEFPHVVKVEAGEGVVTGPDGRKHALRAGDFVYVPDNELHQFINTGNRPFDFICIVPRRGEPSICVLPANP